MDFSSQKLVQTYYQCLDYYHNRSFKPLIPPHFNTQNHDMCHGTIDFDLIEIRVPTLIEITVPYRLWMGS